MLTLSPELLAAQAADHQQPLVEITSSKAGPAMPLVGLPIANKVEYSGTTYTDHFDQGVSSSIYLPDGHLALFYESDYEPYSGYSALMLQLSNSAASEFTPAAQVATSTKQFTDIDCCLIDDDTIGVAAMVTGDVVPPEPPVAEVYSHIRLMRVTTSGAVLGEVKLDELTELVGVSVCKTAAGFALVYIREYQSNWLIYLSTSTDFITWTAPITVTIANRPLATPCREPQLRQVGSGYMLVLSCATTITDTTTIYNLVYSTSTDLVNWSSYQQITDTNLINTDYTNPGLATLSDGTIKLVADKRASYLKMDSSTPGWTSSENMGVWNAAVNSATGKLYISDFYPSLGDKYFQGAAVIDIESWSIINCYHTGSTPALPAIFGPDTSCFRLDRHGIDADNGLISIHTHGSQAAAVIDTVSDSIQGYFFKDYTVTYGPEVAVNVSHDIPEGASLVASDVIGGKLWLAFEFDTGKSLVGGTKNSVKLGYIDLSQNSPPFTFEQMNSGLSADEYGLTGNDWSVRFYPNDGLALSASGALGSYVSTLTVLSLTDDSTWKTYYYEAHQDFPHHGVYDAVLIGSKIYAIPRWDTDYWDDEHKYGLLEIDINSDVMNYHYPPWITTPGFYFYSIHVNEANSELVLRSTNGCAVYNYVTGVWSRFDTSMAGFPPEEESGFYSDAGDTTAIAYDPIRELFFWGGGQSLYMVPRDGSVSELVYVDGVNSSGWIFSEPEPLAVGYDNSMPAVAASSTDALIYSWTVAGPTDAVAVSQGPESFDLSEYLGRKSITAKWALDAPSSLSFTLTDGHLFDPLNKNSMLRAHVAKGRKLSYRRGAMIDGVEHWVDQGVYEVHSTSLELRRGQYPFLTVEAKSQRAQWEQHQVTAVSVSEQTPEAALAEIITEQTGESSINIPAMPLSFEFEAQWLDSYLCDIVDDIAHRYQHFVVDEASGGVSFRPISFAADPVNSYSSDEIYSYVPCDDYSDLTNRITVLGESLQENQITYAEERVASLSGTVGWYTRNKDRKVQYSEDGSRRVKDPRLKVIESATSIGFRLSGEISERISEEDIDHRYCVVEVKSPDLTPVLASGISAYIAGNMIGDATLPMGGMTIPIGRLLEGAGLFAISSVLGAIGNYQYEIWGRPVGYTRRSYAESADDTELQQELGKIVEQRYEGFLCHSPAHCQTVADFEMSIAKAQRKRVRVSKVTNLQDEIGDTVEIPHLYTAIVDRVFITNITRRYRQPEKPGDSAEVTDEIEGWVC